MSNFLKIHKQSSEQKIFTGLSAEALQKRGILKAAQRYGWHDDPDSMVYWRYLVVDPFSGARVWRFKAQPGNSGMKYRWSSVDPEIAKDRAAKQKPDDVLYYAPQGGMALKAAVLSAEGVLHVANGEPAVLVMLSAGYENVLSWFGETSVPNNLVATLHNLSVTRVIYWPDNDNVGRASAAKVKRACQQAGIAFEARHHGVDVDKADLNDLWIEVGFDHHEFRRRLEGAKPAQLPEVYARPAFERLYDDDDSHKERLIRDIERYIYSRAEGRPQQRGDWLNHRSLLRPDDQQPSAGFNTRTGVYKDFGGAGDVMSVWQYAKKLGFRLEDYRPERRSRKLLSASTSSTTPRQAQASGIAVAVQASEPVTISIISPDKSDATDAEADALLGRFWVTLNWRKEHRLLIIGGSIHTAQIVARTRDALAQGLLQPSFTASEFASAIAISKGHVHRYLNLLIGILWTRDGACYTIMPEPDWELFEARCVIPSLQMRHFHDHYCALPQALGAPLMLDDEALEYHITQAEAGKHVAGASNDEMRAYLRALQTLKTEPIRYALPDPWIHTSLYRPKLVLNTVEAYHAAHEARIEDSIGARQDDPEARVFGAQNAWIAAQTGLNVATVRGMTRQMKVAGALIGHHNTAFPQFSRADELLNCGKAEMRRRIETLPADYAGRLISVTCEIQGVRTRYTIIKGISNHVLDKIAQADQVTFRIQQATAYSPGWQDVEAIMGAPSREVADDQCAAKPDPEIQSPATESTSDASPDSTNDDSPTSKRPWTKGAEKTLAKRLRGDPATNAYSAKWLLRQMWIGYRSNPPESIRAQYARALGIQPSTAPPVVIDVPF